MGDERAAQPDPEGLVLSLMPAHLGLAAASPSYSPWLRHEPFPGSHVTGCDQARSSGLYKKPRQGHPHACVEIGPGPQPLSLVLLPGEESLVEPHSPCWRQPSRAEERAGLWSGSPGPKLPATPLPCQLADLGPC